jgi:beta-lactamase class A
MNLRGFLLTIMSTVLITSPSLGASIKSQIFNANKSHLELAMGSELFIG